MALFNKVHQKRLNRLTRAILRQGSYDQHRTQHTCGSPACVMGFVDAVFGEGATYRAGSYKAFLFGDEPEAADAGAIWNQDVTSSSGCNNAGRSGKKAVKFLRKMARDLKAALAA